MNNTIKAILIQEGEPSPNNPVEIKKLLVNEEAEKYINDLKKENQQLKKQKVDVVEYIKKDWYSKNTRDINEIVIGDWRIDILRMLGEIDV